MILTVKNAKLWSNINIKSKIDIIAILLNNYKNI